MPNKQVEPEVLPLSGMSRFSQFKKFLPLSREKFRQLSRQGKAPQPIRMGVRLTMYSNKELHRFLADPLDYKCHE
jgi:predicted DNA-binding transcriptional regulator AlpA